MMHTRSFARFLAGVALLNGLGACAYTTGGPLIKDPSGPIGTIVIKNQSGANFPNVLLSRCSSSTFGLNRLPKGVHLNDKTEYSFQVQAGCWDVHVEVPTAARGSVQARGRLTVTDKATSTFTVGPVTGK